MIENLCVSNAMNRSQVADSDIIEQNNVPDIFYQNLQKNMKPCELINLNQQTFDYDHHTSYFLFT